MEESVEINHAVGNALIAHETLTLLGTTHMALGRLEEARVAFSQVLLGAERLGIPNDELFAHMNLGAVWLEIGDMPAARAAATRVVELSRARGRKYPEGYALALEGLTMVYQGQPGEGIVQLASGLALAREIANKYLELNVLVLHAEALVFCGRGAAAGEAIAAAQQLARTTDNHEHAARLERLETQVAIVAAWSATDDAIARVEIADRLERLVGAARTRGQAAGLAPVLAAKASWLRQLGEPAEAQALLVEAADLAQQVGLEALAAAIAWQRGLVTLALAGPGADGHFGEALRRARTLGLAVLELQAEAEQPGQRAQAARRLRALLAALPPADQAAFLADPDRGALAAAAAESGALDGQLQETLDLMATLNGREALSGLLERSLRSLVDLADADRGFLLLFDGVDVTHQVFYGMTADQSDAFSSSLAYQVLWSGEPLFVEDAQSDATLSCQASIQALALRTMIGMPLLDGSRVIGVIMADSQRINPAFGARQMAMAKALARQVANAILGARQAHQDRALIEELALLHRLAIATVGHSDLDEFMAPVAAEAIALVDAEQAVLLVGDDLIPRAAFNRAGHPLPGDAVPISQTICRWVYANQEPLHLVDAQAAEHFQDQASVISLGLRTLFAVPVTHEERCLGVLYLHHERLGDDDPAALATLGHIGALVGAFLARQNQDSVPRP